MDEMYVSIMWPWKLFTSSFPRPCLFLSLFWRCSFHVQTWKPDLGSGMYWLWSKIWAVASAGWSTVNIYIYLFLELPPALLWWENSKRELFSLQGVPPPPPCCYQVCTVQHVYRCLPYPWFCLQVPSQSCLDPGCLTFSTLKFVKNRHGWRISQDQLTAFMLDGGRAGRLPVYGLWVAQKSALLHKLLLYRSYLSVTKLLLNAIAHLISVSLTFL